MGTIAFRADASVPVGSGHVRRCIALALAARTAGLEPVFVCRRLDGTAAPLLQEAGMEVLWLPASASDPASDAEASAVLLRQRGPDWVLVDHYGLDAGWHEAVRARLGCRVAAVDDLADRPLSVDLLVDANDEDAARTYAARLRRRAAVLAGPTFALLHPAYADAPGYVFHDPVRSIGIFMGGTDPTGACLPALAACDAAGFGGEVEVVCSPAAPHFAALAAACRARPRTTLREALPQLDAFYARHDLLLGAGGTASWERCCIGTPTIAWLTADNQRATLPRLEARGALWWARDEAGLQAAIATLLADAPRRRALADAARRVVDGRGCARIAAVLSALAGVPLRVRPARAADEALTLQRANDPSVRAQSFHPETILPEQHAQWFRAHLGNPQRRLLLVEAANGMPLGQVRLAAQEGHWEIGYLLEAPFRGLGLGGALLQAAFAAAPDARPLAARVQPGNAPSLQIFRRLGFEEQQITDARGPHHLFRGKMPHADR